MGILKSNYPPLTALANARKLGTDAVTRIVRAAGIKEYGVYGTRSAAGQCILNIMGSRKADSIICALDNNDAEHMLLTVLEKNTPAVVEGLAIAGYFAGVETLEIYIPEGNEALEEKVANTARSFGIEVAVKVGMIDVRAVKNSIVHHIETAAAITALLEDTDKYGSTVVVAVKRAGDKTGEPMETAYGKTVLEIIGEEVKEYIKAISIGTRFYDASALDMKIDRDISLGNGVITLFDTKSCMADQAEKAIEQVRRAGCGKCTFCREGAVQIHTMMKDITQGKGKISDLDMIREIGEAMAYSSMCSIGQTGADSVLDILKYFGEEIETHIRRKKCPAEACTSFMNIYIDPSVCIGCGDCLIVCEANCIEGKDDYIHMIDEFDCTKCGKCITACPKSAVVRTTGRVPKLPERLTRVGRFNKR